MHRLLISSLLLVGCFTGSARAEERPAKPIRALLVIGGCCHDYAHQKDILTRGISARANVEWTVAYDPDSSTHHLNPVYQDAHWAKGYDIIVHDECSSDVKDKEVVDRILQPHREGLPAVVLHCGMHCYRVSGSDEWFQFTGLTTHSHGAQNPIAITYLDKESPITKGLTDWTTIPEELYREEKLWASAHPLARGRQGNDDFVVVWTNRYHKTRVFATTLGHNNQTVADARYLDLVTNGLLWATGHLTKEGKPAPGYGPRK
ncbi:MAG: ThuA domain-containing protein [Planctomycetes bacterium]|nr:ThuA domain-containing protein [Planctomycetota bacterium]